MQTAFPALCLSLSLPSNQRGVFVCGRVEGSERVWESRSTRHTSGYAHVDTLSRHTLPRANAILIPSLSIW